MPFKEGTVPCLQPQGKFLREQEGFCTLLKQPGENTASHAATRQLLPYYMSMLLRTYVIAICLVLCNTGRGFHDNCMSNSL